MMETLTFRPPNGLALSPMFSNRLTILIAFVLGSTWLQTSRADEPLVFETTIQPLLAAKCGKCHSDKVRKGDLDLSKMSGLRRGGESGEAAIAETLDDSLLWIMVEDGDMPPEGEPQLTARELELMRKWIDGGAISRQAVPSKEELINQHDVLPIVLLRCTTCHGRQKKQGGLDLRSIATMRKGGVSGPAFVVGKPDESLMIQRIESEACPPRELLLKFFVRRPSRRPRSCATGFTRVRQRSTSRLTSRPPNQIDLSPMKNAVTGRSDDRSLPRTDHRSMSFFSRS